MAKVKAFEHSCGGYYAAREKDDGFHRAPPHCVVTGWGRCWDTPALALRAHRGELPSGARPDGRSSR